VPSKKRPKKPRIHGRMRKARYAARKSSLKRKWSGVKTVGTVEIPY
jgi:hypothetical protein